LTRPCLVDLGASAGQRASGATGGAHAASGQAEEEPTVELSATTTLCWLQLGPDVARAPVRAAEDLRDTA
ncbi:MAG TPA: hypothetical protein VGS62_09800, partial [Streptosporangiaceae bacterium]|nr:hypothetical protein [Streptosporangiaceae bacterium]